MRFFLATLAIVATLALAAPSFAGGVDGTDQALLGLNGIITSPADPIMGIWEGDDRFELPGFTSNVATEFVEDRVTGAVTGTFLFLYRAVAGVGDVAMAIFPVTNFSPDPRFVVIEGAPVATEAPAGFPGS